MSCKILLALAVGTVMGPFASARTVDINRWYSSQEISNLKDGCLLTIVGNLNASASGHVEELKIVENHGEKTHYKVRMFFPNAAKNRHRQFKGVVDSSTCLPLENPSDDDSED